MNVDPLDRHARNISHIWLVLASPSEINGLVYSCYRIVFLLQLSVRLDRRDRLHQLCYGILTHGTIQYMYVPRKCRANAVALPGANLFSGNFIILHVYCRPKADKYSADPVENRLGQHNLMAISWFHRKTHLLNTSLLGGHSHPSAYGSVHNELLCLQPFPQE